MSAFTLQKAFVARTLKIMMCLPQGPRESRKYSRPPKFRDCLSHTASNIFASRNVSIQRRMAHFISDKTVFKAARVVIKCRHFSAGLSVGAIAGPVRGPYTRVPRAKSEEGHAFARIDTFFSPFLLIPLPSPFLTPSLERRHGRDCREKLCQPKRNGRLKSHPRSDKATKRFISLG